MIQAHIKDDFKNLLDYQEWVKDKHTKIRYNDMALREFSPARMQRYIEREPKWYGEGTTYQELINGVTQYRKPELIQDMLDKVNDKISSELRGRIKAKKVRFNPNGLGVFIFDRAAMGMYRLKEYYSPTHHKLVEREEVRERKGGFELIKDQTAVIERWEEREDGKPKVRTTSKNVYAFFPPVSKDKHAVEIFMCCGGHGGVEADDMLYSGISAIVVAQLLEQARIQTKISIAIGTSPDLYKSVYGAIIPVKDYDQPLDINLLALLSSDPRFYRYEGFKGTVALYDHFQGIVPSDFGVGFTVDRLKKTIENSTYTGTKKLAPNRIYLGRTFSEKDALRMIDDAIGQIAKAIEKQP